MVAVFIFIGTDPADNPLSELVRFGVSPPMAGRTHADRILGIEGGGETVTGIQVMACCGQVVAPRRPTENIPLDYDLLNEGVALLLYAIHSEPQESITQAQGVDNVIQGPCDKSTPTRFIDAPDELLLLGGYSAGFRFHLDPDHPSALAADQIRHPFWTHWASPSVIVEYTNSVEKLPYRCLQHAFWGFFTCNHA